MEHQDPPESEAPPYDPDDQLVAGRDPFPNDVPFWGKTPPPEPFPFGEPFLPLPFLPGMPFMPFFPEPFLPLPVRAPMSMGVGS